MHPSSDHEPTIRALAALGREKPAQHRVLLYALRHPGETQEQMAVALGMSRRAFGRALERARANVANFKTLVAETQASS